MAAKKEETAVVIPNVEIKTAVLKIVGDTPLIMHKWSEKAKKEILDKQMKKAKSKGHDAKSPIEDFINSMYWLEGEPEEPTAEALNEAMKHNPRFGFPSVAFKAAAVSAGYRLGVTQNKVSQNAAFHIDGEMVEIHGVPTMREDMVRVGGISKTADIRYRAEFADWYAIIPIRYNAGQISLEQLANLFNLGGFACGVGEWRVEKGGSFGMFHVE